MNLALSLCLQSVDALRGVNSPLATQIASTNQPQLQYPHHNPHHTPHQHQHQHQNKHAPTVSKMSNYPTDSPVQKEDTIPSRVDKNDNPRQEQLPKTYQSQDRYNRNKPRSKPQQPSASEEESMGLQGLGKALGREKEMSPAQGSFPSSLNNPRMQTPHAHFSNVQRTTMRQDKSATATPQQVALMGAHSSSQQESLRSIDGKIGTAAASSSNPQQSSSKREIDSDSLACLEGFNSDASQNFRAAKTEERQSPFDRFNLSPSHSLCDEKAQNKRSNVEGINNGLPQFGDESQLGMQSNRPGRNPNRHCYVHIESPLALEGQSSELTFTRGNWEAPSPFLHDGQSSGFTPTDRDFPEPSPFLFQSQTANFRHNEKKAKPRDYQPQSHGFLPTLSNVVGSSSQQKDCSDFSSNRAGVFHEERHFNSYSQPTGGTSTRRGTPQEARSPLDYNFQLANSSGNQLSSFQTRSLAQPSKHPRFGANRFVDLQEVEFDRSQNSPASSHHTAQSGYKPAYLRYAPQQNEPFQEGESRDTSAPTTPREPLEVGPRFEATGPRDYSALLHTPRHPVNHGHGFEASPGLQSSEFQDGQERSQSAQGFYSATPYNTRPLPPLPQSARWVKEDKAREISGESGKVGELKAGQLRKSKSNVFGNSRESPASSHPRSYAPDVIYPREPPPVPPAAPRLRTGNNSSANTASGVDYLAGISEEAAATSTVICEFLRQKGLEGFIKSLSKSNVQDILATLKDLSTKIDWLGDSLWKGSSDARRLFMDQTNESIKLVYYRVSSVTNVCITIY